MLTTWLGAFGHLQVRAGQMSNHGQMAWDLETGKDYKRTEIQEHHKGSTARGISAPGKATGLDSIMLWWRPEHGEGFGYQDGWTSDASAFYFTGTGQRGDQQFDAPFAENGRVRDHVANGDRIRLLRYVAKNTVRYIGELRLDPDAPFTWIDGLDSTLQTRKMIQFRFLPVGEIEVSDSERLRPLIIGELEASNLPLTPSEPTATDVEALGKKQFKRLVRARAILAERAESILVHAFQAWLLETHGLDATGLRIPYAVEGRNLRADLFIAAPGVLVEAKATAARESIRMAIGQL